MKVKGRSSSVNFQNNTKDSNKKNNKINKKGKKIKTKHQEKANQNRNHSINMNLADNSIINENNGSFINKSYQQDNTIEQYFKNDNSTRNFKEEIKINPEIEYAPKQPQNGVKEIDPQDWENIEMFSSKKFSDILKKHKKVIRYQDSEFNDEESLMEMQSNRNNNSHFQLVDTDEGEDEINGNTYQKPLSRENLNHMHSPDHETFHRFKKAENYHLRKISGQGELKMEELASMKKVQQFSRIERLEDSSEVKNSENNKIFTTSINLLDIDLVSAEKQRETQNISKTQDCREENFEKPPNWNFAGPQKEGFFEGNVTSKKVIVDDLEEFQYDDPIPFDGTGGSGQEKLENISVFEEEETGEDLNQIPFHIEEEIKPQENIRDFNENTHSQEEEGDTLKQMRIIFGSEKKIREQSEAAIKNINLEGSIDEEKQEAEEFQTPGLSLAQSQHEDQQTINSQVFGRSSFQDFSMK